MRKTTKLAGLKYFRPINRKDISTGIVSATEAANSLGLPAMGEKDNGLFLNRFTAGDILAMLEKVGLIKHLDFLGFGHVRVKIFKDEAMINHLQVYDERIDAGNPLIDLRLSESVFMPEKRFFENSVDHIPLNMVVIEWLSAQNPLRNFEPDRPQLPGQSRPGLGSLRYMMKIMYQVGKDLHKDGFMDVPDHFHGAVMYTQKFLFFNPAHEAILQAILRDLKKYSLGDLSWGVITGTIINKKTGEPQVYDPSEQIFPLSNFMKRYFQTRKYRNKFREIYRNRSYHFDYQAMLKKRESILKAEKPDEI
ncbi:MAG: hypothetical protein GX364_04480 [Firmicutes bacterium]|nr:hypothetical protein [Bacillota bacterium]